MAIGRTHLTFGVYAGTALGVGAGWPLWQVAAAASISAAHAHGVLSPDADQSWLAWTGRHRGITHWWGWPALLAAFAPAAGPQGWPLYAIAVGWLSHILLDAVYGKPGVPLLPFAPWWHVGLGLPCEGVREVTVTDWAGRHETVRRQVGHLETRARWVLQWGLVPLAGYVVLAATVLPGLSPAVGTA